MLNVFIDSQIWLSFYKLSSEDLEQLKKLKGLLKKEINLFITQQVIDEVRRNRENVIYESLKGFEKSPELQFPTFVKVYPEYPHIKKSLKELQDNHKDWLGKIKEDIRNGTLIADTIIEEIFTSTKTILPISDEIVQKAKLRYDRGNPPGKDKSFGDAINWEILLKHCNPKETLYFLGNDKDFLSIDKNEFSSFLINEWRLIKNSKIVLCKTLSSFFNQHTHLIKLADTELELNSIIKELEASNSFARTHRILSEFFKHNPENFTNDQIEWLCEIATVNRQVSSIITDEDVTNFFTTLLSMYHRESKDECLDAPVAVININNQLDNPNKKIMPF